MSKYEFLQPKFTEGVLAKSLQGRSSEEFYSYGFNSKDFDGKDYGKLLKLKKNILLNKGLIKTK